VRGAWVARPASLLAEFAEAANAAGDIGLVKDLVNRAEAAAEEDDPDRVDALAARVKALSHSICNPYLRARVLVDLAEAVAIAGNADKADSLAIWAEAVAGRISDPDQYGYTLMRLAEVAAAASGFDRAEALARRIPDPDLQAGTLDELEKTMEAAGYPDRAKAIARPFGDRPAQLTAELLERALANLVEVVATASDTDEANVVPRQAAVVISLTTNQTRRREALIGLAQEVVAAAGTDRAGVLAKRAELLVGSITDRCLQADVLVNLARATAGEPKWADDLTRSIGEPDKWARALAGAAQDIEPVRARRYIALALRLGHWTTPLTALALVQPEVLTAVAEELLPAADR
jgi:hypothetical protein